MASKSVPRKNRGHIYELITWLSESLVKKADRNYVTFKIKDITTGKELTRRVTVRHIDKPTFFINSLEGCTDIKICAEPNQQCKIVNDGTNHYRLEPINT